MKKASPESQIISGSGWIPNSKTDTYRKSGDESVRGMDAVFDTDYPEDTEEMFWLRQNDDLQSKIDLGTALSAQYRYREAISVWRDATEIFPSSKALWLRIGAACLTVMDFDGSIRAYEKYFEFGGAEKDVAYPLGIWNYLQGKYKEASEYFEKILPCGGEMMIAIIYWHCLCYMRLGRELSFLEHYKPEMDVGHHTAYRMVVSVLAGDTDIEDVQTEFDGLNELDLSIAGYGLYRIHKSRGSEDKELLRRILDCRDVWPNVAYLAAWNDAKAED